MRLTWLDITYLTAFPCFMTVGQILFKLTARHAAGRPFWPAVMVFLSQPVFFGALCVYGSGTLLWLWLLSRYPLALAYPFAALALVAVPLMEAVFFGVRINMQYWIGLLSIVIGVLIVTRAQGR